mgnify:FL=1
MLLSDFAKEQRIKHRRMRLTHFVDETGTLRRRWWFEPLPFRFRHWIMGLQARLLGNPWEAL